MNLKLNKAMLLPLGDIPAPFPGKNPLRIVFIPRTIYKSHCKSYKGKLSRSIAQRILDFWPPEYAAIVDRKNRVVEFSRYSHDLVNFALARKYFPKSSTFSGCMNEVLEGWRKPIPAPANTITLTGLPIDPTSFLNLYASNDICSFNYTSLDDETNIPRLYPRRGTFPENIE